MAVVRRARWAACSLVAAVAGCSAGSASNCLAAATAGGVQIDLRPYLSVMRHVSTVTVCDEVACYRLEAVELRHQPVPIIPLPSDGTTRTTVRVKVEVDGILKVQDALQVPDLVPPASRCNRQIRTALLRLTADGRLEPVEAASTP